VRDHLQQGEAGQIPETPKQTPANVQVRIIGSNAVSLAAAEATARKQGFRVLNLGPFIEGETRQVAVACAGVVRSIHAHGTPISPPACLLLGGETTVTLGDNPGKGGRNQEFVLAMLCRLGEAAMKDVVILSGGTDGEDGPTDAAGAIGSLATLQSAKRLGLDPLAHLNRHDAYPFFKSTGDLIQTGLTSTNVMDVRVVLV
jgi:hydroxypyruvate reductase/glycerate 2-kinase